MERIIECVPNFSEGHDRKVIDSIVAAIRGEGRDGCAGAGAGDAVQDATWGAEEGDAGQSSRTGESPVRGPKVLGVEIGQAANRTVVTFAGSPEAVIEGAFRGVRRASELIDMRQHHGVHPRLGATDVLPVVPVAGITLEECAVMARDLARRIYEELGIPCYCYEASALRPAFRNLAVCRSGEYEALADKIADPERRPDFGPETLTETAVRSGATTVGARDFLIAVNFNLNTDSAREADEIAKDVRESGRAKRDPATGEIIRDVSGKAVRIPGTLRGCKAIGWYIEEYGKAQVSMNITDMHSTPLHRAFTEVSRAAQARGFKVTGTEIIGLVPKSALLDAGRYFLSKADGTQGCGQSGGNNANYEAGSEGCSGAASESCRKAGSEGYSEAASESRRKAGSEGCSGAASESCRKAGSEGCSQADLIAAAVRAMGLDELRPFDPETKVIEFMLEKR